MECEICKRLENKDLIIFEDEKLAAVMGTAALGHVRIIPKKHAKSFSELDKKDVTYIFKVASIISSLLFETLGLHGTNIVANTLKPHIAVDIMPRKLDDNIELQWERKPMPDDQLSEVQKKIKDKTDVIGAAKPEAQVKEEVKEEIEDTKDAVNYLLKQIERIP
ncbi:HIT family protein [Candidatus Woesearchaeota archaeon]|nr:HIT family protein [Candidatus Woesearchaeota archaeon]